MREQANVAFRLFLAHHPLCHRFGADRFGPVCSGCAVFVPALFASAAFAVAAYLRGADALALAAAGTVLGLPQLLTTRWRFSRSVRAGVKLLGGAGLAIANVGLLMLPIPAWAKACLFFIEAVVLAGLLAVRMRSILATCHACPWQRDWEHCPGFVRGAPADPPDRRGAPVSLPP